MATLIDFDQARYSRTCSCGSAGSCSACRHFLAIYRDVCARRRDQRAELRRERRDLAVMRKASCR